jgi:hypothetical protein
VFIFTELPPEYGCPLMLTIVNEPDEGDPVGEVQPMVSPGASAFNAESKPASGVIVKPKKK